MWNKSAEGGFLFYRKLYGPRTFAAAWGPIRFLKKSLTSIPYLLYNNLRRRKTDIVCLWNADFFHGV